jgi:hypothetical protein
MPLFVTLPGIPLMPLFGILGDLRSERDKSLADSQHQGLSSFWTVHIQLSHQIFVSIGDPRQDQQQKSHQLSSSQISDP